MRRSRPFVLSKIVFEWTKRRVLEYEHPVRLAQANQTNDVRTVEGRHDACLRLQLNLIQTQRRRPRHRHTGPSASATRGIYWNSKQNKCLWWDGLEVCCPNWFRLCPQKMKKKKQNTDSSVTTTRACRWSHHRNLPKCGANSPPGGTSTPPVRVSRRGLYVYFYLSTLCDLCHKKVCPLIFDNFGKCRAVFKILSLIDL